MDKLVIDKILGTVFWHNEIYDYLLVITCFLTGVFLIKMWQFFVDSKLSRIIPEKINKIFRIIENNFIALLYFLLLYFCLQFLKFPPKINSIVNSTITIIFGVFIILFINSALLDHFVKRYIKSRVGSEQASSIFTSQFFLNFSKIIIWIVGIAFLADILGFKITPLMAGLGISGVAVALAAQVLLKDLFSCFAIYFDRPFNVGDFIVVGDFLGTVEYTGIKTTRLRSLGGEELILANSDLTEARVRNYKRMQKRRISFNVKVTYDTSLEKLQSIPKAIEEVIMNTEFTTFDRAHLASFDEYGFLFEVVYYVLSGDYNKYMDVQQMINFGIVGYFDAQGINFAQRIYPVDKSS
jgi:small-conductance mechanosensitive channel